MQKEWNREFVQSNSKDTADHLPHHQSSSIHHHFQGRNHPEKSLLPRLLHQNQLKTPMREIKIKVKTTNYRVLAELYMKKKGIIRKQTKWCRQTWGNVVGGGIEMILEVRNVILILLQDLIAVSQQLLERHRREWHGFQNVEVITGGGYSPINALNKGCWGRI